MDWKELLDKYGKKCPKCRSGHITSDLRYEGDVVVGGHRCLDCGHKFKDSEAVV